MRTVDADDLKHKFAQITYVRYTADMGQGGFEMFSEKEIEEIIDKAPTVWLKQGEWIIVDDTEKFIAKCSICGRIEDSRMVKDYPYCHCGAKMKGGAE